MAARSVWKGYIRFGLVSLPVKAYTATSSEGGGIALNQLHKDCNSRIKYQKVCPVHGELKAGDIVSGYEFAKDQYVVIDTSELEKLRTPRERAIDIDAFIPPDQIDPSYFSGKSYYLLPDGPIAQKPYVLLQRLMSEENKAAVAQVVLFGHEQVVLVRAKEGMLVMSPLSYAAEVRKPAEFADEVPHVEVNPGEMKIAKSLVDAMTPEQFDFAQFKDVYADRLRALVEAKVEGRDIVAPPAEEPQSIGNLMEALAEEPGAGQIQGRQTGQAAKAGGSERRRPRQGGQATQDILSCLQRGRVYKLWQTPIRWRRAQAAPIYWQLTDGTCCNSPTFA